MDMRASKDSFREMNLPCRVSVGSVDFQGVAIEIEPHFAIVYVPASTTPWAPHVAERIVIEVGLPGGPRKCLSIRGQVTRVTEAEGGGRNLEVSIRRASFEDTKLGSPSIDWGLPEKGTVM